MSKIRKWELGWNLRCILLSRTQLCRASIVNTVATVYACVARRRFVGEADS